MCVDIFDDNSYEVLSYVGPKLDSFVNVEYESPCWENTGGLQVWAPTSSDPQEQITTSSWTPH